MGNIIISYNSEQKLPLVINKGFQVWKCGIIVIIGVQIIKVETIFLHFVFKYYIYIYLQNKWESQFAQLHVKFVRDCPSNNLNEKHPYPLSLKDNINPFERNTLLSVFFERLSVKIKKLGLALKRSVTLCFVLLRQLNFANCLPKVNQVMYGINTASVHFSPVATVFLQLC